MPDGEACQEYVHPSRGPPPHRSQGPWCSATPGDLWLKSSDRLVVMGADGICGSLTVG